MTGRSISYLLAFMFLQRAALAQSTDSSRYFISYQTSGTWNITGESSLMIFNNTLKLGLKRKDVGISVNGSWLYGTQDQQLVNNDLSSAAYIDIYKTWEHFNYWGLVTYDRSYSLDLQNLFQLGMGGAYNLIHKKYLLFNISDGIIYEQSQIVENDARRISNKTFRNSLRLMYSLKWKDLLTFDGTHFIQSSFATSQDYILKSNSTVFIKVLKGLHLTGSVIYNRLNVTGRENLITTFGMSFEKTF